MADGVADAFDSPEMHKASEEGGEGVAKDVTKGVEKENKRKNPFVVDARRAQGLNFKDALNDVDFPSFDRRHAQGGARAVSGSPTRSVTASTRQQEARPFDSARGHQVPDAKITPSDKGGEDAGNTFGEGASKSQERRITFKKFGESLSSLAPKPINWLAIFGPTTLAPIIGSIVSLIGLVVQATRVPRPRRRRRRCRRRRDRRGRAARHRRAGRRVQGADEAVGEVQGDNAKKLLKPWEQFGTATQEFLLPGIENLLEAIQLLIPQFVDFGTEIGRIFGDMATFAGAIFTSEKNMRALGTVLDSSKAFFTNIRTAALNVADILLPFLAASPRSPSSSPSRSPPGRPASKRSSTKASRSTTWGSPPGHSSTSSTPGTTSSSCSPGSR